MRCSYGGFRKKTSQFAQRKLTQKQLAAMIGIKHSVISFYELGDRIPSPEVIKKIAITLHVSADYLLGIEKGGTVSVAGLDEDDKAFIRTLVDKLRIKNKSVLDT